MILSQIQIHSVRNISYASVQLHPKFNFIHGPNGSGKTSLLESLYLICCGHSFRTRENISLVSHNQEQLTVFARGYDETSLSIQKSLSDLTTIKFNNENLTTTSQLAYILPCQAIYSDIFQIIDAGPSVRRSILDWGLFHVKHEYLRLWKEYKRALKQRNALLKTRASYSLFIPWDKQMNDLGEELDGLRSEYFILWQRKFQEVLLGLSDSISCEIEYYKGWDKKKTGKNLYHTLEDHFESDMNKQYTQYGPHQADIHILNKEGKVKGTLSRGQQKTILIALRIAQGLLLDKDCLYLFDDLRAELDDKNYKRIVAFLKEQKGQFVITGVVDEFSDGSSNGISDCYVHSIHCGEIETVGLPA